MPVRSPSDARTTCWTWMFSGCSGSSARLVTPSSSTATNLFAIFTDRLERRQGLVVGQVLADARRALEEADQLADRIAVIDRGTVIADEIDLLKW